MCTLSIHPTIVRTVRRRILHASEADFVAFISDLEAQLEPAKVARRTELAATYEGADGHLSFQESDPFLPRWSLRLRDGDRIILQGTAEQVSEVQQLADAREIRISIGGALSVPAIELRLGTALATVEMILRSESKQWLDQADAVASVWFKRFTPRWAFTRTPLIYLLPVAAMTLLGIVAFVPGASSNPALLIGSLSAIIVTVIWAPLTFVPSVRIGGRKLISWHDLARWVLSTAFAAVLAYFVLKLLRLE